jgi:outer membrane protein
MKEYNGRKDLEGYKAQSEEKGRQLDAEIKRAQRRCQFQSQAQANGQTCKHNKKGAELQKRATIELCPTSFILNNNNKKVVRNGHFSKWRKSFIKAYGKEKGYSLYLWYGDAASVLYAEDNTHYKRYRKSIKRQIQSRC